MNQNVVLALGLASLVLLIVVNIVMFISLGKQGDERRKTIIQKTSSNTFAVTVVYILFCIVEGIYLSVKQGTPIEGMNPIILLTTISIIYVVQLLYFKRKFGD